MHKQVMIIEDDRDIRESLSTGLSLIGVETIQAKHGQEALDILEKIEPPSLILLDLMMPVMDGWQFRAAQQNNGRISSIPIVLLTADDNAVAKAKKMGVDRGMAKPIDLMELLDVVKHHIS